MIRDQGGIMSNQQRRDIDGVGRTIWDLFNNRRYAIDTYQREYKWQTKQVVELLNDLAGKFTEHYEKGQDRSEVAKFGHYFLGSVILSQKEGESYIIDGQQRLTTLSLLLIYLNHRQKKCSEEDQVEIDSLLLAKKFGKKTFNLDVPERAICLEHLYRGEPYEPTSKDPEAVRNMAARYKDIEDNFSADIPNEALPYFLDWLLNNVHLVEITAYSDDDAYTIFETMNDRGLSLAPLDMLKSFLIANITDEDHREHVNKIWKKTTNDLLELGKEEPADAVKAWLRSQYAETIRERKKEAKAGDFDRQATEFHRWVRENEKALKLAKSPDYVRIVERDFDFYLRQYQMLRRASQQPMAGLENVYHIGLLEFTHQYPLLLAPVTPDDSETVRLRKYRIVAAFVDILIARRVWNFRSIAYSTLQYAMFLVIRDIRRKSASELVKILSKRLSKEEEDFSTNPALRLHQQNRYSIKWLLARMADYCEITSGLPSQIKNYMAWGRTRTYDIEHVWADHWEQHKDDFQHQADFDEFRNRLGDLLLLPKSFNESYGDLPYEKKLPHYMKHNLLAQSLNPNAYKHNPPLAKLIKSGLSFKAHRTFRKSDIETRQKLYISIAQRVWNTSRLEEAAE
jgi:uncharacterized protein with ParB-like and HNH nuclease domain